MTPKRPTRARGVWLFFLFALLPVAAPAQPAPEAGGAVLDLESLVREAMAANPLLRAARLEAAAMATRPRQVSALPDPSASASYRPFAVGGVDGLVPGQVMVEQMIPYPGKRRLAGEAAAFEAERVAHEAGELALELAYEVRDAYYELFRIQEQDRLVQAFQAQLDAFEQAAAAKYEVGTGTQQAILRAQLERTALARQRLDLAAERRMQAERLARLTDRPGLAADPDRLVLERPALAPAPVDTAAAFAARPELLAIRAGLNGADAEVELAKKEYLPDFVVGAGIMDMMGMEAEARPLDDLGRRFGVSFGVAIPLRRGRRDAALEEARLRRSQLEARLDAARTEIRTEASALQGRLREEAAALALYRDTLVPQSETTLEAALSAYTTGRADFLDLLDAQRMRFDLGMDYEATYAGSLRTRARLERVLGAAPAALAPTGPDPFSLESAAGAPAQDR